MSLIAVELVMRKRPIPGSATFDGSKGPLESLPGEVHVAEPVSYSSATLGPTTLCGQDTRYMTPRPEWQLASGWRPSPEYSYCRVCFDKTDYLLSPS